MSATADCTIGDHAVPERPLTVQPVDARDPPTYQELQIESQNLVSAFSRFGQIDYVNADERHQRFCWPAEDRVRARTPFQAPRISPVFTASVFLPAHYCGLPFMQVSPDWRMMGEQDGDWPGGDES